MKLSTMLLPTGEFILVGSDTKLRPEQLDLKSFKEARDTVGAAAFLFFSEDVEVEDAFFDENARRANPPTPLSDAADMFTNTFMRPAVDGDTDISPQAMDFLYGGHTRPTEGDANLSRQLLEGASFSPAGLVTSTRDRSLQDYADGGHVDLGGAKTKINGDDVEEADIGFVEAMEPRLISQTVTRAETDPGTWGYHISGEFGRSPYTGPITHDLNLDDLTIGDWAPQVGDFVKITGPSYFGVDKMVGLTGTVIWNIHNNNPEGHVLVKTTDEDWTVFVAHENLELVDFAPEVPMDDEDRSFLTTDIRGRSIDDITGEEWNQMAAKSNG